MTRIYDEQFTSLIASLDPTNLPPYAPADSLQNLLILQSALRGTGTDEEKLPVPRAMIDDKMAAFINTTYHIPLADMLDALSQVQHPNKVFWLQTNHLDIKPDITKADFGSRGYLCKVADDNSIELYPVQHYGIKPKSAGSFSLGRVERITATRMDQHDGLLDDLMEADESVALRLIESNHRCLEFIARALVVLSSPLAPNDFWQPQTPASIEARRQEFINNNRRQRTMNRPALLPVKPVVADLSRLPQLGPNPTKKDIKEFRKLLGIINVAGSRIWISHKTGEKMRNKDGTYIVTGPHKRCIAAQVDKTEMPRIVTIRHPVELDLTPDYPILRPRKPGGPRNT